MIKIYPFGLSNKTEKKDIRLSGDGSSTHRINNLKEEDQSIDKIDLVDINDFIESNKIDEIDEVLPLTRKRFSKFSRSFSYLNIQ